VSNTVVRQCVNMLASLCNAQHLLAGLDSDVVRGGAGRAVL
jgi:hypothetical protein